MGEKMIREREKNLNTPTSTSKLQSLQMHIINRNPIITQIRLPGFLVGFFFFHFAFEGFTEGYGLPTCIIFTEKHCETILHSVQTINE